MNDSHGFSSPPPSRTNLERSLTYGGMGLRRFQQFLLNTYLFLAGCGAWLFAAAIFFGSTKLAMIGFSVLVFFGPPIFFGWMSLRQMQVKRVDVNDAGIIIDDGHSREDYAFSDVEALKFVWIPYLVFKANFIMKDGRKLSLPAMVERLDYPLDLFAAARPDLASDPSFMHYRRIAICLDHTWARLGQTMANPVRAVFSAVGRFLFTIVCAAGVTSLGQQMGWFPKMEHFSSFMLWATDVLFMSLMVWVLSYAAFETRFYFASMKRLKDDPYAVKRDMRKEAEVRAKTVRWTYAGSLVMALVVAVIASADLREHQDRAHAEQASEAPAKTNPDQAGNEAQGN
jgi:hypothetical protein